MTCDACDLALADPTTGRFNRDCRSCSVRAMSQAPRSIRETYYRMLPEGEREQFIEDVQAEYTRRQAVRRAVG